MLLIVMHNDEEYLQKVVEILEKENIAEVNIVRKAGLGSSIIGDNEISIYNYEQMQPEYDKAVIAIVREDKIQKIVKKINTSSETKVFNMRNKGFICLVPYSNYCLKEKKGEKQ